MLTHRDDVIFVQARNANVHQGCSLTAIVELGKLKGYELICATTTNAILVRSEFYSRFGLQNNHPMMLFKPPMDGRIFHGYDSTVFSIGMPHLIWSGFTIDHMDIQVLPLSARRYGGAVDN